MSVYSLSPRVCFTLGVTWEYLWLYLLFFSVPISHFLPFPSHVLLCLLSHFLDLLWRQYHCCVASCHEFTFQFSPYVFSSPVVSLCCWAVLLRGPALGCCVSSLQVGHEIVGQEENQSKEGRVPSSQREKHASKGQSLDTVSPAHHSKPHVWHVGYVCWYFLF